TAGGRRRGGRSRRSPGRGSARPGASTSGRCRGPPRRSGRRGRRATGRRGRSHPAGRSSGGCASRAGSWLRGPGEGPRGGGHRGQAAWSAFAAELGAWQAAGRVATFWWRDDDAGRPHPGFERLLALAARTGVPLGLAVVPAWLAPEVATALRDAPPAVAVLRHRRAPPN